MGECGAAEAGGTAPEGRNREGSLNWPTRGLPLSRQSFITLATCSFLKRGGNGRGGSETFLLEFATWNLLVTLMRPVSTKLC